MKNQLTQLITAFRSINTENAITPESLGSLLQTIVDAIPSDGGSSSSTPTEPGGSGYAEYCFGSLNSLTSTATVEQLLKFDMFSFKTNSPRLANFNTKGEDEPFLTALQDCIVEVHGYVTMKATDSYTADRILRWFRLDADGERYAGAIITTHFSGTTQIFSVPIAYSVKMDAGDTLSLVHYSSSGVTSISANSSLFFKVIPV